jgi:hypothetical protein
MSKTTRLLKKYRAEPKTPVADSYFLPNHSGDMSSGHIPKAPVKDTDLVNKEYVDNVIKFGEIFAHDASAAQSYPSGAVYTKSTQWTLNGLSHGATNDVANDKITINSVGKYKVDCSICGSSATANITWLASIFSDNTEQDQIHWRRKFGTATAEGSMSMTGLIHVTSVPCDVDLRFRHDSGTAKDFTITYANMNLSLLGVV